MAKHQLVGYVACNPMISQFDENEHRVQVVVKIADGKILDNPFATWLSARDAQMFSDIAKGDTVAVYANRVVDNMDGKVFGLDPETQLPLVKVRGFESIELLEKTYTAIETQDEAKIRQNVGLLRRSGAVEQAASLLDRIFGRKNAKV